MTFEQLNQRMLDTRICQHSLTRLRYCECVRCVLWRIEMATMEKERSERLERKQQLSWMQRLFGKRG